MKKLINAPETVVRESLDGFCAAHADIVTLGEEHKFVRRRALKPGKVALISGGGSGHEPLHTGFVGHGMLDAACPGQVFTSPTPDQMVAAAKAVDTGGGCLFIVKNYAGDVMNFEMAAEMAGGNVTTVITDDDVAVEASTFSTGRRGVAGTLILEKMVGAAAEEGRGLPSCRHSANGSTARPAQWAWQSPRARCPRRENQPSTLADNEMEMGVGIHGEPGRRRVKLWHGGRHRRGDRWRGAAGSRRRSAAVAVCSSSTVSAALRLMELYLMVHAAERSSTRPAFKLARSLVGSYVTSLEMAGCSVTVSMLDDELARLWDAPVHTAALRWAI